MTSPTSTHFRSSPPLLTLSKPQPLSPEDLPTAIKPTDTEQQTQYIHPSLQNNPYAEEPTYFTRPNRYFGPTSTWRAWTEADRAVVTSLDRIRSQDLSIHLFNSFVLRKRNAIRRSEVVSRRRKAERDKKGKGKAIDRQSDNDGADDYGRYQRGNEQQDDGELIDLPRAWSSWPLPPDIVPREEFLPTLSESGAWRREKDTRPSAVLEECLIASTTKFAKEMWDTREWEGGHSPRSLHNGSDEENRDGRSRKSAAIESNEPREPQFFSSQVFAHDGSSSASSSSDETTSQDNEVSNDREGDDNVSSETIDDEHESGESDEDELEKDEDDDEGEDDDEDDENATNEYRSDEDGDEVSSNNDSASSANTEQSYQTKPVFTADDDKIRRLVLPSTRHIISKLDNLLAALHKARAPYTHGRKRRRTVKGGQFYSTETENFTTTDIETDTGIPGQSSPSQSANSSKSRKTKVKIRHQLAPRDWSDVIGLAAITGGFSQQTIQRASERCARLFDENMLMRTFHEDGQVIGLGTTRESEGPWFEESFIINENEQDEEADGDEDDMLTNREEDDAQSIPAEDVYVTAIRSSAACTRCYTRRERCIPPKRLPTNTPHNSTVSCSRCLSLPSVTCSGITINIKNSEHSPPNLPAQPSEQITCPHPTCECHTIPFAAHTALTQHIETTHNGINTPLTKHNLNRRIPTLKRSFSSMSMSAHTSSDAAGASSPVLNPATNQQIYCPIPDCDRNNSYQVTARPFKRGYRLYEHIRTKHPTVDVEEVKQMEKKRRGENRGRWRDGRRRSTRGSRSETRGRNLAEDEQDDDQDDHDSDQNRDGDENDDDGSEAIQRHTNHGRNADGHEEDEMTNQSMQEDSDEVNESDEPEVHDDNNNNNNNTKEHQMSTNSNDHSHDQDEISSITTSDGEYQE